MFLGFAVASLTYVVNLKVTKTAGLNQPDFLFAIYCWSASAIVGSIATLSRFLDFRYTARKIKDSSTADKRKAKLLGNVTWWLRIYLKGGIAVKKPNKIET